MASIEQYYEQYWEAPEQYNDPTTPLRQALLRTHLASLPKGARGLDVGCGRGEFCQFFQKELGFTAAGTDLSQAAIAYAQKHHPGIDFRAGPIEQFVADWRESMDFVFCSEVVEHLFDVPAFLSDLNRCTKPDGLVLLTTPYHGLIKNLAITLTNFAGHYDVAGQHIRFFDTKGLTRVLTHAGYQPLHWTGYGRPWPFWKSFFVVAKKIGEPKAGKTVT
jgi:2-polyprenyl-3-methyl-5-hydroxy-6-metoxy-1,4-benzoquinol methylase